MKVKIEQVNKYIVTIDGIRYHDFRYGGEWEGLLKFSGPNGMVIVHDPQETTFADVFESMFGPKRKQENTEFSAVKISPSLLPTNDTDTGEA